MLLTLSLAALGGAIGASLRGLTGVTGWLYPEQGPWVLGGFTTFSAFSLETMTLIERGETASAALYILLSVGLSVGALAVGLLIARGLFA